MHSGENPVFGQENPDSTSSRTGKIVKVFTHGIIGIDGLIPPDLPYEEKEDFLPLCRQYGVDLISMLAPTSEKRIAIFAREAEGFLYIVSSLGVTGTRSEIKTDLNAIVQVVRQNTTVPCAINFGIPPPEQAKRMADISDGAIVGSAIIKFLPTSANM